MKINFYRHRWKRLVAGLVIALTFYGALLTRYSEEGGESSSFRSKNLLSNTEKDGSDVQSLRKYQVRNQCRTFVDDYENLKIALLVDTNQTFAYCHVPKVASSAWMMFFAEINSKSQNDFPQNLSGAKDDFINLHSSVMRQYSFHVRNESDLSRRRLFKFVFLRHPFERLVSAYFDKFVQDPDPYFVRSVTVGEPYDVEHIQNTVKKLLKESKSNQKIIETISFKRFVKFVLYELKTGKISHGTYHWMPYTNFCGLCKIDYDFVGKMESLWSDLDSLKEHIPEEYKEKIDRIFASNKNASLGKSNSTALKYFSQISKNLILRLYRAFMMDFELGDYPYPEEYINDLEQCRGFVKVHLETSTGFKSGA